MDKDIFVSVVFLRGKMSRYIRKLHIKNRQDFEMFSYRQQPEEFLRR